MVIVMAPADTSLEIMSIAVAMGFGCLFAVVLLFVNLVFGLFAFRSGIGLIEDFLRLIGRFDDPHD